VLLSSPLVLRTVESPPPAAAEPGDFDALYASYFPFVWRCLRGLGVQDAALDDAAQDVFVVVHRQLSHFRGQSSVRTWLYGIVRNVAFNHKRRAARKGGGLELDGHTPSTDPGPAEELADREAADFVRRFVDGLDEKKRGVFVLAVLEELSIPEVAEALAIPLNTAYSRLRAVRAEFRAAAAAMRTR
jgi:RNA polymerase sigma-70 factor, ECF subfamily